MKLITTEIKNDGVIVAFPMDNLDVSNIKDFRESMQILTSRYNTILLDMRALNFVDSSGLGALLSSLRAMNSKDGKLRLFNMTTPVRTLFELVRMHRIFIICDSLEEAIKDVESAQP